LSLIRKYRFDVFVLLWVPYVLLVYRFWFVADDAFIPFRYARNLVLGHGLRYNLGDHPPVEGYSNFLWTMVCAILEFFRMDITFWPPLLSAACGTVLLWLVFDQLRRRLGLNLPITVMASLFLGCFPPFALWSTSGLAVMPLALLIFVTFERLVLRRPVADGIGGGIAGLLLALLRIEGIAWAALILVLALISRRIAGERSLRPFFVFALITGIGYAIYFTWRYAYYELPLPSTAYIKLSLDVLLLRRGVNYVLSHVLTFVTPILIVPGSLLALRRKRIAVGLPVAALAWAFPAYSIVVTGDFMAMGRFLVPGLPFNAILFAWIAEDLWRRRALPRAALASAAVAAIFVGLLPGWNIHLIPQGVREEFRFRFGRSAPGSEFEQWQRQVENVADWSTLGRAIKSYVTQRNLADPPPSLVMGGIGAVGYYSGLYIYDQHGLVTPEVAWRKVSATQQLHSPGHDKYVTGDYFLKDKPTILFAIVVQEASHEKVANACRWYARLLREAHQEVPVDHLYVADFVRVPTADARDQPQYLITWTRIAEGVDWRDAWEAFDKRVSALEHNGYLPLPL
jgi:hypothetical protein